MRLHALGRLFFAFSLLAFSSRAAAAQQTHTVRGSVTDAQSGAPIAAAQVSIGGTTLGAATGADGAFAINGVTDGAHDVIVNLQGDLPALDPAQIRIVAEALGDADISTLAAEIDDPAERTNPSVVKPVVAWQADGLSGRALYFTRSPAPSGEGALFHHIGIYAFRRESLARFVSLPPSPLEKREKLEQLRALEAGMTIRVARVDSVPLSVDTPADLEKARALLGHK